MFSFANWAEWTLAAGALLGFVLVWWLSRAPKGYEDDTGFHYGDPDPPLEWDVYDQEPVRKDPPDFSMSFVDDWSGWGRR